MKVKDFIKALKLAKCWKDGTITFWLDNDILELDSMSEGNFDLREIDIIFTKIKEEENE